MNEVKRWGHKERLGVIFSEERPDGKFVKYEDYEALQQQLTATTNSLTNAQEALKSAGIEADTVQAGVMELKAQRDALAAENGALKEFIKAECFICNDDGFDLDAEQAMPETPATDAYLNAVRAEGVDALASLAGQNYQHHSKNREQQKKWKNVVLLCVQFAAQLRAGKTGKDGSHE